ncbi:hypothetical protein BKA83DRAFT_687455 [Pisolithus microcarpus]|nr:hypothetical protein BKA83DRAFT_687455 [Pisolithus microcarpus]
MASQPTVIAVMGPSGSGKTNFINQLTNTRGDRAAHQSYSHTWSVREYTVNLTKDRRYVFVDTPAFDATYRSDWDILRVIAEWLEKKYRRKVNLNGIIYTHRITDVRMFGPVWKNLDMFGRLCGDRAAGGVRLVSTMWDQVRDGELVESRVSQLEKNFWRPLIEAGARHKRFEENSSRCAWEIIGDLTGGGEPLLLQQELADVGMKLNETTAGQAVYAQLQKRLHEQKETIEWLQGETDAQKDPDLVKERRRLEAELQRTSEEMERLKIPFCRRIALFFSKKTHPNSAITFKDVDEPQ